MVRIRRHFWRRPASRVKRSRMKRDRSAGRSSGKGGWSEKRGQ
jgi:hypothetical protein